MKTILDIVLYGFAAWGIVSTSRDLYSFANKAKREALLVEQKTKAYLLQMESNALSKVKSAQDHFADFLKFVKGL